ncbi:MAG: hypothetical protein SPI30_04485 [Prevotella sp.]|nr:hypothetical protein [Prevotella sp.]
MPTNERKQSTSDVSSEGCDIGGLMTDWGSTCNETEVQHKVSCHRPALCHEIMTTGNAPDIISFDNPALHAIVPSVGSLRTNHWYASYQLLVLVVPSIGTIGIRHQR